MRVLFILKESLMTERMGIMYLSAALKSQGYETRLVLFDSVGIQKLRELIRGYEPAVIGYSVMTGEQIWLLEFNKIIKKEFNFLSVFGGPHATFFPDLIHEDGVDAICVGEGDIAFPEFCKRVAEGKEFWETPNFWSKHKGEIIQNPLMPLVEEIDTLPLPDRDIMYEADSSLCNESCKMFFTSRGCPYRCTYCFNSKYNEIYRNKGPVMRYRSAESVINEICIVKKHYPLDVVRIVDDNFLAKPKEWFDCFSKLYKERVCLPLAIIARANLVTDKIISLLKDAGLDSVWMGVECGNQNISDTVLERNLTNKQIINAAFTIQKYDIKLVTQNLVGLPVRDSYQVDLETLDFNINIKPTFAWSSILYPYPSTPIESYAQASGLIKGKIPALETNKRTSVLNFSVKEKRKINNLHKLFGLIVHFPFLRRFTDFLCSLPLGRVYVMVFYLWYGYNIKFKLHPFRSFKKELGNYVYLWWRFIRKS